MADEVLKRDESYTPVLGGVTNDSDKEIRNLLVDPTSKRLLVSLPETITGDLTIDGNFTVNDDITMLGALYFDSPNLQSGTYTVGASDYLIPVNTSSSATINLPAADAGTLGRVLLIADATGGAVANNITISPDGSDTIEGSGSYTIDTAFGNVELFASGGNWVIKNERN